MNRILLIAFAAFLSVPCAFSQTGANAPIYFDKDWKTVPDKTNAAYYRTVERQGNKYLVRDYFISGKIQMEAMCSEYEPKLKFDGLKKVYYENGNLQEEGKFDDYNSLGTHKTYYSNAQLKTETNHDGKKSRYLHYYDSLGKELLINGNAIVRESTSPSIYGDKRISQRYVDIRDFETLGTFYIDDALDTTYLIVEESAAYKGGISRLSKDLGKELKYPAAARRERKAGKVFVSFIVDKSGKLHDVKMIKGFFAPCDEEAVRAIKALPNWNPGYHRGRPVNSRFVMPIVFTL